MKVYEKKLLNDLIDRYERSQQFIQEEPANRGVHLLFKKKYIPEYFSDEHNAYEVINRTCVHLEAQGWITIKWHNQKVGYIIERVTLNTKALEAIYAYLKRKPKNVKMNDVNQLLESYKNKHEVLDAFMTFIKERLQANLSVSKYFDLEDLKSLEKLLIAVCGVLQNTHECYIREFSMRLFQDSKAFEQIENKVKQILITFDKRNEWLQEKESILAEYNLFKNPSYVMLKGCGKLQLGDTIIDLKDLPNGIGINSKDLEKLKVLKCEAVHKVMTIENLTVFNRWHEEGALMIYLGGYHNEARRTLLKRVAIGYEKSAFFHWGDIDCGGFRIFNDLRFKTQITFKPYLMDRATLIKYAHYCKPLTENDRKGLNAIRDEPSFSQFKEAIDVMLEKNTKLEQEIIAYEMMHDKPLVTE